MKDRKMVNIGIDIGTTNTVVGIIDRSGWLRTFNFTDNGSSNGNALVPSVIYVDETAGNPTWGEPAKQEWANPNADPTLLFRRWKLQMGENPGGRPPGRLLAEVGPKNARIRITPEYLTTTLVEQVANKVVAGDDGQVIENAVVTVPHGWRRSQWEKCVATRSAASAARIGGKPLNVRWPTVDEPVAAAAYWLYKTPNRDDLTGKTVLVVDVGGGTFDMSLVKVGTKDEPLKVLDAANTNVAGDYVTAIVLAEGIKSINKQVGMTIHTDPAGLLSEIEQGTHPWLRTSFAQAERLMQDLSFSVRQFDNRNLDPIQVGSESKKAVIGPESANIMSMNPSQFVTALAPFYDRGRAFMRQFLRRQAPGDFPYAVMLAGGGSNIGGIASRIIGPAFADFESVDVNAVMSRVKLNETSGPSAIALGAALIADGRVSIQEQLLYDVGLTLDLTPAQAEKLGISEGEYGYQCVVSPWLERGSCMGASVSKEDLRLPTLSVSAAKDGSRSFIQDVWIFDDPDHPWSQSWQIEHPADGKEVKNVQVQVKADPDGGLGISVSDGAGHVDISWIGALERATDDQAAAGGSGLAVSTVNKMARTGRKSCPPVRTPLQITKALKGTR